MILKVTGLALITISLTMLGSSLSTDEIEKHKEKENALNLLKEIERGIKYSNKTISEILKQSDYTFSSGYVFNDFSIEKQTDNNKEGNKLFEFFKKIGKSTNSEHELILCREYIEFFEDEVRKSSENSAKKAYFYKRMGLVTGLISVIILI